MVYNNNEPLLISYSNNDELVQEIKNQAANIRFNSEESAAYHTLIHRVDPLCDYLKEAHSVIENGRFIIKEPNNDEIEVEFYVKLNDKQISSCCVKVFEKKSCFSNIYSKKENNKRKEKFIFSRLILTT